jgi:hypothetical protein
MIYKWLIVNLVAAFIMSTLYCFILVGKVQGFSDPGVEKVIYFTILSLGTSLFLGIPIFLFSILRKNRPQFIREGIIVVLGYSVLFTPLFLGDKLFALSLLTVYIASYCFYFIWLKRKEYN